MKFTRFLASQAPLLAIFTAIIALAAFMLFSAGVGSGACSRRSGRIGRASGASSAIWTPVRTRSTIRSG